MGTMKPISAILLAMFCWAGAAGAQGPPACSGDVERFCPDVQAGGGRIVKCLREHTPELSQPCKDALARMGRGGGQMRQRPPWAKSCEADVTKLCQGVARGGGRIHACLESHRSEVSPDCRTALDQRPRRGAGPAGSAPTAAPTQAKP